MLAGGRPVGYLQHDPGVELGPTEKQLKEINTSTSADRRQTSWLFAQSNGRRVGSMSPETSNGAQAQVDQELLQVIEHHIWST